MPPNKLDGPPAVAGQIPIYDGIQWVAGDPDCNIIKWNGTTLTARDITLLLDKLANLDVALSTRALEAGGNLAALVAGINNSKWGGTALTGRDISTDLSKLDVALSTLGLKVNQEITQSRAGYTLVRGTAGVQVPATTWTTIATYTVAVGKTLYLTGLYFALMGNAAGTAPTGGALTRITVSGTYIVQHFQAAAATPFILYFSPPFKVAAAATVLVEGYCTVNNEWEVANLYGWVE